MGRAVGVLLLVLGGFILAPGGPGRIPERVVYAPELFGSARLVVWYGPGSRFEGLVLADGAAFWLTGRVRGDRASGVLVQLTGERLEDRPCPECAGYPIGRVPFELRLGDRKFTGRIFFRGHWRPFCGGVGGRPRTCGETEPAGSVIAGWCPRSDEPAARSINWRLYRNVA